VTLSRLWVILLAALGCNRSIELGSDWLRADGGRGSAGNSAIDASAPSCEVTRCDNKIYACGDCLDNDADGLVDGEDPECLGACDDTEDSYFSGMAGQSDATCKVDCYFDGDNGSGNDDCHWSHRCDPLSQSPDYPPSGDAQCAYDPLASVPGIALGCSDLLGAQSETCLAVCLPLTPTGCDCFGCCELPLGSKHHVWLGSTLNGEGSCNAATLSDPAKCHPCTPVSGCLK
jgi:hypothetical protein